MLQALLPPETVPPLVVHGPALPPQQAVGYEQASDVHRTARCALQRNLSLPQTLPELGLLDVDGFATVALGAPVLAHHLADEAFQKPGNAPAGPRRPCADVPGSEVALSKVLDHRLLQFRFRQHLLEPGVLLLQLTQPFGFLGLHPAYC